MASIPERLMAKISPEPNSGCWLWCAAADPNGYGRMSVTGRAGALAHRLSYAAFKGPVGDDDCVLHKCNVPSCINPDHLYLGDRADNMRDTVAADHHLYGDRHMHSKISEADAAIILNSKERGAVLARRFGISPALVCMIRKGKKRTYLRKVQSYGK